MKDKLPSTCVTGDNECWKNMVCEKYSPIKTLKNKSPLSTNPWIMAFVERKGNIQHSYRNYRMSCLSVCWFVHLPVCLLVCQKKWTFQMTKINLQLIPGLNSFRQNVREEQKQSNEPKCLSAIFNSPSLSTMGLCFIHLTNFFHWVVNVNLH